MDAYEDERREVAALLRGERSVVVALAVVKDVEVVVAEDNALPKRSGGPPPPPSGAVSSEPVVVSAVGRGRRSSVAASAVCRDVFEKECDECWCCG